MTFELELSAKPLRSQLDKASFESEELFDDWTVWVFPVKKGCEVGIGGGRSVGVCCDPSLTCMSMKRDWVGDWFGGEMELLAESVGVGTATEGRSKISGSQ